jgi:2-polyprenyl-3-methyl-5-hydroxy-6-metoxy-1,4-benzoquinol methylase
MDHNELDRFYEADYRIQQQRTESPTYNKIAFERARGTYLATLVTRCLTGTRSHLDIGCAAGELIKSIGQAFRCESMGIEPSVEYRRYLSDNGIQAVSSVENLPHERRFDLVTMVHVLEHIPDPVKYLRHLRENIISPQGHLLVEVPNLLVHTSFEPAHLYAFMRETLDATLRMAGFEPTITMLHHEPRNRDPRPHYLTMIARVSNEPVTVNLRTATSPGRIARMRRFNQSRVGCYLIHPLFYSKLFVKDLLQGRFSCLRSGSRV